MSKSPNVYKNRMSKSSRSKERIRTIMQRIYKKYPNATPKFVHSVLGRINQESLHDADRLEEAHTVSQTLNGNKSRSINGNVLTTTFKNLTESQKTAALASLPAALKIKFVKTLTSPVVMGGKGVTVGRLHKSELTSIQNAFKGVDVTVKDDKGNDVTKNILEIQKSDYSSQSHTDKLNYMYLGKKDSDFQGGARGVLQATYANYGGLDTKNVDYDRYAKEQGFKGYDDLFNNGTYGDDVDFALNKMERDYKAKHGSKTTNTEYFAGMDSFKKVSKIINPGEQGNSEDGTHDQGYWGDESLKSLTKDWENEKNLANLMPEANRPHRKDGDASSSNENNFLPDFINKV